MICALLSYGSLVVGLAVAVAAWLATQRVAAWDFATTTALVTGGSTGIGLETAKALAQRGVRHIVIAARRETVLQEAVKTVEEVAKASNSPTKVFYVCVDVCDEASVKQAVSRAESLCDGATINLLICNAGYAVPQRFMESSMAEAQSMMATNYFGCLNAMWAVMPSMLAQGRGRVVLTSSMVARAPIAGYSLYGATKAGMRALAHSVDMENSCLGVRVQVVSPPDVETPGFEKENEIKSPECAAISSFGGATPFSAKDMGVAIVAGIHHYRFDTTLGSDGLLLGLGGAGMEPATSTIELIGQTVAGGVLRLGLAVVSRLHYGIVCKIRVTNAKNGKQKKTA